MSEFILACILITCSLAGVTFFPKQPERDARIKKIGYTVLLVLGVILTVILFPWPNFPVVTVQ